MSEQQTTIEELREALELMKTYQLEVLEFNGIKLIKQSWEESAKEPKGMFDNKESDKSDDELEDEELLYYSSGK